MKNVPLTEFVHWRNKLLSQLGLRTPSRELYSIQQLIRLGLLDRPEGSHRGVACFSYRHLLQLLAIDYSLRLDHTLLEIQQRWLGLNPVQLEQQLSETLSRNSISLRQLAERSLPRPSGAGEFWQVIPNRSSSTTPAHSERLQPLNGMEIWLDYTRLPAQFCRETFLTAVQLGLPSITTSSRRGHLS